MEDNTKQQVVDIVFQHKDFVYKCRSETPNFSVNDKGEITLQTRSLTSDDIKKSLLCTLSSDPAIFLGKTSISHRNRKIRKIATK